MAAIIYSSNFYLSLTIFSAFPVSGIACSLSRPQNLSPTLCVFACKTKCGKGLGDRAIPLLKIFLMLEISEMITGEFWAFSSSQQLTNSQGKFLSVKKSETYFEIKSLETLFSNIFHSLSMLSRVKREKNTTNWQFVPDHIGN